ncbi:hypothetical protein D3C80_1484400 [compost metagenome]
MRTGFFSMPETMRSRMSWVLGAKIRLSGEGRFNSFATCFWASGMTSPNTRSHLRSAKRLASAQAWTWASKLASGHR